MKKPINIDVFCVGEVELVYKRRGKTTSNYYVKSSVDADTFFRGRWENPDTMEIRESAYALFLNRAHKIIAMTKISEGGVTRTVIDIKLINSIAVRKLATSVILAHNHPSGNLKPSEADINVTRKLKSSLSLMDVTLLDHLIITEDGYKSFADEGLM